MGNLSFVRDIIFLSCEDVHHMSVKRDIKQIKKSATFVVIVIYAFFDNVCYIFFVLVKTCVLTQITAQ